MKRVVDKGKTLLVDGPASVIIILGEVEVLGASLKTGVKIVVREGKRIPLKIKEKAEFDLALGERAAVNEVEGSTIPVSWGKAADEVLDREKPVTVMVVGGVDSGKTSFCAYLANRALRESRSVALIDADLGQSDVGPPSTIGSCRLTKPIIDPFEIGAESICFVGVTSPSGAVSKVVEGIAGMKEKALKRGVDILIINTDGWIEGEDAVRYKVALAKEIKPDLLVGIQEKGELTFLLGALTETQNLVVESSPAVRKRDREERKLLRELGYKKYLKGARTESFPLRWIRVGGVAVRKGDEEGLLVALHDVNENFLGIGVVEGIDYERRVIRVFTPVREGVASLIVGRVKLDRKGREIGLSDVFAERKTNFACVCALG